MDYMREQLRALMGSHALDGGEIEAMTITSPTVCKDYLCGLCPSDLFTNTKADSGPCRSIHSDALKSVFMELCEAQTADPKVRQVEEEHIVNMRRLVDDCDRRIRIYSKRLEEAQALDQNSGLFDDIALLSDQIQEKVAQIEFMAARGEVSEAFDQLGLLEPDYYEKERKEKQLQSAASNEPSGTQGDNHQKLRVCNICGAYLSIVDSDRRLMDHFIGKLHMGYDQIREQYKELSGKYGGGRRFSDDTRRHSDDRRQDDYRRFDGGRGGGGFGGGGRGRRGGRDRY